MASVRAAVIRPGGLWRAVESAARTGSTNADLLARARDGAAEGLVLVAEEQTAGRGRMGRRWVSPPYAALMFSLLVRPAWLAPARLGWLPLLAGVAVATAVRDVAGVDAMLKWPNDVLADGGKLAGILAEAAGGQAGGGVGGAVVVGIGINVSTRTEELPALSPGSLPATSLFAAGARQVGRERLLAAILLAFERRYLALRQADGDPAVIGTEYAALSGTIGRQVRVELPGGQLLSGEAVGVDPAGRLIVGQAAVAAGDVVHVR